MQKQTQHVAGLLYDGVLTPGDWYAGLDKMCSALGATVFHYFTLDHRSATVLSSVDNQASIEIHERKLREYESYYVTSDIRMAILQQLPAGNVMLDHEHIAPHTMSRNAFYCDFLGTHGLRNTIAVQVRKDNTASDFLGFLRATDRHTYTAQDKAWMEQLMPDLQRAAHLRAHVGSLARNAALGLAALHTLPQSLIVVDADSRIYYSNPAADRLLFSSDVLCVRYGLLQCSSGAAHTQLQQHIERACASRGAILAGVQSFAGKHKRLTAAVLPLKASHAAAAHWQRPMALVMLTDLDAPGGLDSRLVGEMLGLSPTETRLALLLAAGKTVKDFAAVEGISWHTARSHTKNLLRKTGCHRQLELVALLQSLRIG